jgi:hypothetical protein
VFFGTALLVLHACSSCSKVPPEPPIAKLTPEARAALRGLWVAPASGKPPQLSWRLANGCQLEYSAHLASADARFTVTGGIHGALGLEYPQELAEAGTRSSLSLQSVDNARQLRVYKVSETVDDRGQVMAIAYGLYDESFGASEEAPPPWSHVGSRPGLRVYFPPLPHFQLPEWDMSWNPIGASQSIVVRTRLEGWFDIGGHPTALVSARSEDGRFDGTYLVLASGRLLWARVVVAGQPRVLEARLVSACDGPTLMP